jgi:hypothetical protein
VAAAASKSDLERTELSKQKTGVFTGAVTRLGVVRPSASSFCCLNRQIEWLLMEGHGCTTSAAISAAAVSDSLWCVGSISGGLLQLWLAAVPVREGRIRIDKPRARHAVQAATL